MVEEQKMIRGFDPYASSSSNVNEFFNFEQQNNNNSNNNNSDLFWKPSSSKPAMIVGTGTGDFTQFDDQRCVLIPCEPNERPSQGLSLSLSSTNPSTIGIQPFELVRPPQNHQNHNIHPHQGYLGKPLYMHEQLHDHMMPDESHIMNTGAQHQSGQYNLRSSRYLIPTQDLLNEFCNLGAKQNDYSIKAKAQRTNQSQDHDHSSINMSASSSKNIPLNSIEFLELQKRKSKLLQMLDEV